MDAFFTLMLIFYFHFFSWAAWEFLIEKLVWVHPKGNHRIFQVCNWIVRKWIYFFACLPDESNGAPHRWQVHQKMKLKPHCKEALKLQWRTRKFENFVACLGTSLMTAMDQSKFFFKIYRPWVICKNFTSYFMNRKFNKENKAAL